MSDTLLLSIEGESINLVRRLCKVVSNAGLGAMDLFPERLASAFQDEILNANSKVIEDGVRLGEFLHEAGFKASAKVLKLCLDYYQNDVPNGTGPCAMDKERQRYKIIVTLLQAQVRHSMREEAQSTREQALEFIEKWKLSVGIHLAEVYSALGSLASLEGDFQKSFELSSKGLDLMNASTDYYTTEHEAMMDIFGQATISYINFHKRSHEGTEIAIDLALDLVKKTHGRRSTKYADILAISYHYFRGREDLKRAGRAARECLDIRMEAFGFNNVITESARNNWKEACFAIFRWMLENGLLQEDPEAE